MRLAVISDIHGNLEAFTSVWEDIKCQKIDEIMSLGDNIGYGADSEKIMQRIMAHDIPSVCGNHEMAALNQKVLKWFTGDVRKAVELSISSLSNASLQYLQTMKISVSDSGCLFVHGFPPDSYRLYLNQVGIPQIIDAFNEMEEPVCFVGHTHKLHLVYPEKDEVAFQKMDKDIVSLDRNKQYIINAGSVGQTRDGTVDATYVIWDSSAGQIEIRRIKYDNITAAEKIIAAGIPERFARFLDQRL